ncbi:hypothetical protein HR45_00080 [Shewanella mangrovi]|uniref:Uncharacterized protein n=1 Tax=Shewanella mangrovi TaxID=1515746 RepID=A0A094JG08_9GAMM|nr:hypothetical protein HR45_00080 [Shewanella mangrovi]
MQLQHESLLICPLAIAHHFTEQMCKQMAKKSQIPWILNNVNNISRFIPTQSGYGPLKNIPKLLTAVLS